MATRPKKRQKRNVKDPVSVDIPIDPQILESDVSLNNQSVAVPTKTQDGGARPKRKSKTNKGTPALDRQDSSNFVETTHPWPDHFKALERLHKALNTTYILFSTRKHLATTLDSMKSLVRSGCGKEPSIEEVAQIAYLIPRSLTFRYVDEAELDVNVSETPTRGRGRDAVDPYAPIETQDDEIGVERNQVLLIEYIDGELKRQVQNPVTGEAEPPKTKLRKDALKLPVYSQKQMINLVAKRNKKFTSAVNYHLNTCASEVVDPVEELILKSADFVPTQPRSRSMTPIVQRSRLPAAIPEPEDRASIPDIIDELKRTAGFYTSQIVPDGHRVFAAQEPIYGELNFQLSQNLVNALYHTKSIEKFFSHQAEALNNLHDGHDVIISTSTSSGKSLIYQLPVLHELEKDIDTRAMYIFPTKALAQDQRRSLKDILRYLPGLEEIVVETFDGDTEMNDRNRIREEARIIFTNPDMLHITILPHEEAWRTFLKNLKYVVVDELHVYNGLFGSHVAMIMRRLRRVCAAVGNDNIRFISCSATVANPEEQMRAIFRIDNVKLTDVDGSPSGSKTFLCWNVPFRDPQDPTSGRGDSVKETAKLFCQLILRGVRVIAFARIRQSCENLIKAIRKELANLDRPEVVDRVMSYRGGYTPQDRREIEQQMFKGALLGIVGTTALELGIDIGSLDAVITMGFPYTIANLRQQSGRAGRRNKDSLSILVGDSFPTDQYFMSNPDELFTRPNCSLQVDLENMLCLEAHLQCAAHEMPIRPNEDEKYFGPLIHTVTSERMRKDDQGFYHCSARFLPNPSRLVAIRDTEETHFAIIDTTNGRNIVLEDLEGSRAFFTIYEGGIFLHQGSSYLVKEFCQDKMLARVEKVDVSWTTQQRDYTDIDPVETEVIRRIPDSQSRAFMGPIRIKQVVYGFFKMDAKRRVLDAVQVDNPPIVLFSKGFWLDVPKSALLILTSHNLNVAAGIHAAEHAILSLMPNFVISMPGDVRTECKISLKEFAKQKSNRKRPARLTFYDAKGGSTGSGISTRAFEHVDMLLRQAAERVTACYCLQGCLECCCSERCKDANQVISKAGAEVILKSLLNWEIDVDALPYGEEEIAPAGIETVVEASEVRPRAGVTKEMVEVVVASKTI
ncbi:P-loop containing nucleoside triphosphate hydrolase protein [Microthyrium microscopicum]|uniref:P-loop containing nucleoside triphosphate hydrolase protein n=1 Tax=Microthyrium microscopicum TaxID=703497 RepID=A0A6A6TYQ6_9PEZI|nr:P-loop containing nucleoside triphosphate hydrolase protein [Microthyrium microscopicum]